MSFWDILFKAIGSVGAILGIYLFWTRRVRLAVTIDDPLPQEIPDPGAMSVPTIYARIVNLSHERSARLFRVSLCGQRPDSDEWVLICRADSMPLVLEPRARHAIHFDPIASTSTSCNILRVEVETEDGQVQCSAVHRLFRR